MITFVAHQDIHPEKWNAAIRGSLCPTMFAFYDFLTLAHPDWNALVEDDYRHVMPLPCRSKFGIHYIFTPHFISRLGLFGPEQESEELMTHFYQTIPKKYKQIDLMLNQFNHAQHLSTLKVRSCQLSLNQPYDTIYPQYKENHKRNIKKAGQFDLIYTESGKIDDIIALFKENKGREKQVPFKKSDYERLRKLAQQAFSLEKLTIATVTNKTHQILCGALFLRDHNCYRFWFSGRDNQFRDQYGMFFLIDEFIKRHAVQPMSLDFNGSMDDNVARLYQGFGAIPYSFEMLHVAQPFLLNPVIKLIKRIK